MGSNNRNAGIDMLRILSMFLIVILHVLGQGGAMVRISTHPETYHVCWLMECTALCAVNCYGLISGYVGVRSTWRPSRILYLWVIVFFYSVLITVLGRAFWPDYLAGIEVPSNFADLQISGRMYCTTGARWNPRAPAMSRVKQATQKPMLPGLPSWTRATAMRPMSPPATQGPWRDVNILSISYEDLQIS